MGAVNPSSVLAGLGGATKAVGAYDAASSQRSALEYQASVASNNATLAGDKAAFAEQNGLVTDQNLGLKEAQTFGLQRANMGANGVDLGSGSPNDVLTSTKLLAGRDMAQVQTNAMREAWGYTTQQADFTSNAKALAGMAASVNPITPTLGSLLTSAGQVSSAWKQYDVVTNGTGG